MGSRFSNGCDFSFDRRQCPLERGVVSSENLQLLIIATEVLIDGFKPLFQLADSLVGIAVVLRPRLWLSLGLSLELQQLAHVLGIELNQLADMLGL